MLKLFIDYDSYLFINNNYNLGSTSRIRFVIIQGITALLCYATETLLYVDYPLVEETIDRPVT